MPVTPTRLVLLLALLGATFACGGATTTQGAGATQATQATPASQATEARPSASLPPELEAFHDVFEPVWHGAEDSRGERACAAAEALFDHAEANHNAARTNPPATVVEQDRWVTRSLDLVTAARHLDEACDEEAALPPARVEAVHDAYHALTDLL